jgi:hypothetical protein
LDRKLQVKPQPEIPVNSEPAKPQKPSRKSPGRKRAATSARRLAPGRGAARLRSAINNLVGRESDRLARALSDKAVAGNMAAARLLVEISGADKEPPEKKKKRKGPSWAELLVAEPEWDPNEDENYDHHDASKLLPSEPDWPDEPE